jgi:hypothetical protein
MGQKFDVAAASRAPQVQRATTIVLAILLAVVLAIAVLATGMRSSASESTNPLVAAWDAGRSTGSYHFRSDVVQTTTPSATVANAGRTSESQTLFMEGDSDVTATAMELTVWSDSAVPTESNSVGLRVIDGVALQRQGAGEWEPVVTALDTIVPAGDFLAYLDAARDITALGVDTSNGAAVTGYSFRVDGPTLADGIAGQLEQTGQLLAGSRVAVTSLYSELSGFGELWVGIDGLPVRQTMSLELPESNGESVTATVSVDFSQYGTATIPGVDRSSGVDWSLSALLSQHGDSLVLLAAAVATLLMLALLAHLVGFHPAPKRSVSMLLALGLVSGALVSNDSATAASPEVPSYDASRAAAAPQQATVAAARAVEQARTNDVLDPNADPLVGFAPIRRAGALQQAAPIGGQPDTTSDTDLDGLTDFVEMRLGTNPDEPDSDGDGIDDEREVKGFVIGSDGCQVNNNVVCWYGDPNSADSNGDGIPDTTEWLNDADGDGIPDMFSDDNDGDEVPDRLDPAPNTFGGETFGEDNALDLRVDGLTTGASLTTFVDFQLRPKDPERLQLNLLRIDWPADDDGQILDVNDGPADEDVRLVPMLEILVPKGDELPAKAVLDPSRIQVDSTNKNVDRRVVVPLTVVTDAETGNDVAFAGRMIYNSDATWQSAHEVRLMWIVQVNNDIACDPDAVPLEEGCTVDGYIFDRPQAVQTYYEDWSLTGLTVTEEQGTDLAVIYEDPAVDGNQLDDGPTWALGDVLTERFLSAAPDTDTFEITTPTLEAELDRDELGSAPSAFYGVPNVFQVDVESSATLDEALIDASGNRIPAVLANVFASGQPGESTPQPLVTTAYTTGLRRLGIDGGDGYVTTLGNEVSLNLEPAGAAVTPTQLVSGIKWNPFCRSGVAWAACDLGDFWAELDARYGHILLDPDTLLTEVVTLDPLLALGQNRIVQVHATMMITGLNVPTQITSPLGDTKILSTSDEDLGELNERIGLSASEG